ncbi:hypothetical protein Vadar_016295 [Vaccinium darrowii]|uniref:Uncharacterized protein n=1 Tax=Vaccinium darrowii TaxID=229202 RepID=A0ACB7YWV9_9ERIC|nr:hypothetical protein Vadar_016295 [Vaccinium darrowii]
MDIDRDGVVSCREYTDATTKDGYKLDGLDVLDKSGDRTPDFNEFVTFDSTYNSCGYMRYSGCSFVLSGIYFVCVTCNDAGKTYELCDKCYADKSYEHEDDHTCFREIHSSIQLRKPKPGFPSQDIFKVTPNTLNTAKMVANLAAGSPLCSIM